MNPDLMSVRALAPECPTVLTLAYPPDAIFFETRFPSKNLIAIGSDGLPYRVVKRMWSTGGLEVAQYRGRVLRSWRTWRQEKK